MEPINVELLWLLGGYIQALMIVRYTSAKDTDHPVAAVCMLLVFAPLVTVILGIALIYGLTYWLSTGRLPE